MKHINIQLVLVLLLLTQSSCSLYRKFETPKIDNTEICGDTIELDTVSEEMSITWKEMFKDEILQNLIERGINQNVDLQVAKLNITKAETALLAAKLSYLPSFAMGASGGLNHVQSSTTTYTYNVSVSAQWELDIWGRIRNNKEKAKVELYSSREYANLVQTQLVASIANTYYTLVMLDEQSQITKETLRNQKENLEAVRSLKEAGLQSELSVNQAEANYMSVAASYEEIKNQINIVENNLALILNEVPQKYQRTTYTNTLGVCETLQDSISLLVISNRPDVRIAEYRLSSTFYDVNIARSAFYPSISLGGNVGWTNNIGVIINPAKFLYSAIASLTQPLFNRGANIANLKMSKSTYEQALIMFHQSVLSAGNEVNSLLSKRQSAENKMAIRRGQIDASRRAYINSVELMKYSSLSYTEVLMSENMYLVAQLTQVADWFEYIQSNINLYRALGGGVD